MRWSKPSLILILSVPGMGTTFIHLISKEISGRQRVQFKRKGSFRELNEFRFSFSLSATFPCHYRINVLSPIHGSNM